MVDVTAASNSESASGPSSAQQSGVSTPLRISAVLQAHTHGQDSNLFLDPLSFATRGDVEAFPDDHQEQSDTDIYRGGGRPPSPPPRPPDAEEISVATSSSSSSLNVGRRIGALANAVEAALGRWSRARSSASSTTSFSSSTTSISSTFRSHTTRRLKGTRYSASASVHNAAHERALLARKKAHEEFRAVPREFTLLLPPRGLPSPASRSATYHEEKKDSRVIVTASLQLISNQLESALKKSAKSRRASERPTFSDTSATRAADKGKGKAAIGPAGRVSKAEGSNLETTGRKAPQKSWWLDVASPTWDDLCSLGKLLHLHPLTLEDILHRDPREKLELFPGLGYYFIVFRAIESERSRERFRRFKLQGTDDTIALPSSSADEGVVGAVNVYMVVFSEGICSFHFEDVSEHTDKLRNRILQMDQTFDMTSDWIAHGFMDSIVDSFFPLLTSIEKELKTVESLVVEDPSSYASATSTSTTESSDSTPAGSSSSMDSIVREKASSGRNETSADEKGSYEKEAKSLLHLSIRPPWSHLALMSRVRCAMRKMFRNWRTKGDVKEAEPMTAAFQTLVRIAAIRRIVTSLGRLLGTKGEVVAQIRKRLILSTIEGNSVNLGFDIPGDGEVPIYMGDIHDHIITLQQSLGHYERVLSHSHPAYLSRLNLSQSEARGDTDKAILLLTVVSLTVFVIQVILGIFSMNVGVIKSRIAGTAEHPFTAFFAVMGASILLGISVVALARFWYMRAKKKYLRARSI